MFDRDESITEERVKFTTTTKKGNRVKRPVTLRYANGRINLIKLPFELKDEIKACMSEPRWNNDHKYWSVVDDIRSRFQLQLLTAQGNPYANWEGPVEQLTYSRPLMPHQKDMTNEALGRHYKILAAEMGVGKSLTLIELMERGDCSDWWYVSTKSGCEAVEEQFDIWELKGSPTLMTYSGLLSRASKWEPGDHIPQGLILDEFSRCTNSHAKRAQAARLFADQIRGRYGWDGFVIGASGSCSPKSPIGWWMLCEIVMPGFLRENNAKSFEWRLGIFREEEFGGQKFPVRKAWRDNELRCDTCGSFEYEPILDDYGVPTGQFTDELTHVDTFGLPKTDHEYIPSKNEVTLLHERMTGLVSTYFKKDVLDLPPIKYEEHILPPTPTVKRAAKALASGARTTIQALTWLRSLSDGFQYEVKETDTLIKCEVCNGTGEYKAWEAEGDDFESWGDYEKIAVPCEVCLGSGEVPKFIREAKYFKGPKQEALEQCLDKCDSHGRIVVSAGFTASIDQCVKICHAKGWHVLRVDGRGWKILRHDGEKVPRGTKLMRYWRKCEEKLALVMHPESGGTGLTLTEAYMIVAYSNDFKPENRIQMVNRIHRPGMTRGAVIVDLIHLGTDRKVLNTLKDNHRLEKLSLGDLTESLE